MNGSWKLPLLKTRKLLWARRHRERRSQTAARNETASATRFWLAQPVRPGPHVYLSVFPAATSTITLHHSSFINHPLSYGVHLDTDAWDKVVFGFSQMWWWSPGLTKLLLRQAAGSVLFQSFISISISF